MGNSGRARWASGWPRPWCWPPAAPACRTRPSRSRASSSRSAARSRRRTPAEAGEVDGQHRDHGRQRAARPPAAATAARPAARPAAAGGGGGGADGPNQASDVGVTANQIVIGNIVAENGVLGDAFAPAARGMRAWAAAINAKGGIHGRQVVLKTTLAAHIRQAHICAMSRIACNCGAIYEAAPIRRPRDPDPFKCLVCGKKLNAGEYRIGELRIVARPEPDRD